MESTKMLKSNFTQHFLKTGIISIIFGLLSQTAFADPAALIEKINIIDSYKGSSNAPKSSPLQELENARLQHQLHFQEISKKSEYLTYAKKCEELGGAFYAEQRIDFFDEVDDLSDPRSPCQLKVNSSYTGYYLQCRSNIQLTCLARE